MLLEKVMLSCGPQALAISSMAQLNEQWSMTTFFTGFVRAAFDLERIAVVGIRAVGIVAGAHANVLHQHVRGVNTQPSAADHDARRWRGLAGDGHAGCCG